MGTKEEWEGLSALCVIIASFFVCCVCSPKIIANFVYNNEEKYNFQIVVLLLMFFCFKYLAFKYVPHKIVPFFKYLLIMVPLFYPGCLKKYLI